MLLALPARHAVGQPNPDRQAWVQALAIGQLSERWRSHVEVQPRIFDGASELGLTIVRGALGRVVHPRLTVFAGYAWVPRTYGDGVRHEQRLWQQLSLTGPGLGRWTTSGRVRLEQRWLDPWADTSHRLRLMARAQRPVGGRGWGVYAYDELMVTLDDTASGPQDGFDRNRLSAGVSRRVSPVMSFDAGYLWERGVFNGDGRRHDHIAIAVVNVSLPRR